VLRLQKALELDPHDTQSLSNLGVAYRQLGKNDEAIKLMEKASEELPHDAQLANNLGVAYRKQRRYEEAIVSFQKAVDEKPDEVSFRRNLAIALRSAERYQEAIPQYVAVTKKDRSDAGALYDLAACYEKMGQTDDAAKAYQQYAELVRYSDEKGAKRATERADSLKNP
jgi:Flp pilus assembly protein TadD